MPHYSWLFLATLWNILLILASRYTLIGGEMAVDGYFPSLDQPETIQSTDMLFILFAAVIYVISFLASFGHELKRMEANRAVNA